MASGAGIKKAGGISFGVSMVTGRLAKDVQTARKLLGGFVSSVTKQIFSLKGALVGLGGALAAGKFVNLIKDQFKAVDALGDTAQALNVTSAALAGLGYAADQSGSSQASIEKGLTKLVKSTNDAASGLGTMAGTYRMLGLDAAKLNQLAPDQQFLAVADAISKLDNKQDQLAATQRIFGKGASDLVGVLRLGSEGLREMQTEAGALGIAIDEKSVRGIQRAMDAFNGFKAGVAGIFRSIAVEIAPFIEGVSDKMKGFLAAGEKGKSVGKAIGGFIIDAVKMIADTAQKAFAGLLRFAAMGMDFFNQLRSSKFAGQMGISAPSVADFQVPLMLKNKAAFLEHEKNLPSTLIDKMTAGIKTETAAEVDGPVRSAAFDALKGVFDKGKGMLGNIAATPGAMLQGMMDNPIAQAQRAMAFADLKSMMGSAPEPGKKISNKIADFNANESGSLAAYQQRIRGKQQFGKAEKIQEKQLDVQEESRDSLKVIAGAFKGFVAEGAVS